MTIKEIQVEIKTIQKISDNSEAKAICDVLLDLTKLIIEKENIGFTVKESINV